VFNPCDRPRVLQEYLLGELKREKREQEARLRDVVVQRRLNPQSVLPDPMPEPRVAIQGEPAFWEALFPFAPIVDNGTITWHRHWTILLKQIAVPLAALVGWSVALVALQGANLLAGFLTPLFVVLLIVIVGYMAWQYDDWRNDIYVLEPTRIIDLERLPLGLYEDRREALLSAIQNVDIESPSLWSRIFGYGNVQIETAGATGNFTFDHVSDPRDVQRVVFAYQERFRKQGRERELNATLDLVDAYLQRQSGNQPTP
jgi:membrane protein YdbS with pleckstrin-like domain